jgi:hypothetical protein
VRACCRPVPHVRRRRRARMGRQSPLAAAPSDDFRASAESLRGMRRAYSTRKGRP